jgi:hypothetical protein
VQQATDPHEARNLTGTPDRLQNLEHCCRLAFVLQKTGNCFRQTLNIIRVANVRICSMSRTSRGICFLTRSVFR